MPMSMCTDRVLLRTGASVAEAMFTLSAPLLLPQSFLLLFFPPLFFPAPSFFLFCIL